MTKVAPVGRPTKPSQHLLKQVILRTALPIVQKGGVDGLSFRVLAEQLGVTRMAVAYHAANKKQLLTDLVELTFREVVDGIEERSPGKRARNILATYYGYVLKNANLLRAILGDVTLMSADLARGADLKASTDQPKNSDGGNILAHLLIDYTHGFVLSASSRENNPLTIDDFLRGVDWILDQTAGRSEAI